MRYIYSDDSISFQYQIVQKKQTRHNYIRITNDIVIVTANTKSTLKSLHSFVSSKRSWISKHLNKTKTAKQAKLTDEDATIYLLGTAYKIQTTIDKEIKKEKLELRNEHMHFSLAGTPSHEKLRTLRDEYYKSLCQDTITPIVQNFSQQMGLHPNKISYRHTKTRWGSCSGQNNISLNTRLMMLPLSLIHYIVIHELSHIKHKNHSKSFWDLVGRYEPEWKSKRKELRDYEKLF